MPLVISLASFTIFLLAFPSFRAAFFSRAGHFYARHAAITPLPPAHHSGQFEAAETLHTTYGLAAFARCRRTAAIELSSPPADYAIDAAAFGQSPHLYFAAFF